MKKNIIYYKVYCLFMLLMGVNLNVIAQSNEVFEGEITFETYENYSESYYTFANSIIFNGVHKMRLILKGDKMHLIDETTKCHILADNSVPSYVHYCDLTKTGVDYGEKYTGAAQILSKSTIEVIDGHPCSISNYTFSPTETKKNILDNECVLYQGDVKRKISGMEIKYELKAYISDIKAPGGYKWLMYCLEIPGIALKYSCKYDGGHVSAKNIGEMSYYYEFDVTSITPRKVADVEFSLPKDYKISNVSKNPLSLMNFYKGVNKRLEELGVKGDSIDNKRKGVHYKTNGEWEF